eukprot:5530321-Alexandrium_andersonii.AAC.1
MRRPSRSTQANPGALTNGRRASEVFADLGWQCVEDGEGARARGGSGALCFYIDAAAAIKRCA